MQQPGFVKKKSVALESALLNVQRRHGALLEIVCVCAAVAVFVAGIIVPFSVQNRSLNDRIAKRRADISRYVSLAANGDRIVRDYDRLFPGASDSTGTDPSVAALKAIEEFAGRSSVKIVNIRQTRTVNGAFLHQVIVEFTTQGQKEQYVRFLYALRAPESPCIVRKCVLQVRKDSVLLDGQFTIVFNAA